MASKKKLLQAAAGSAGGAGLDVDEVFSTYLYEGTASSQVIENGIALGNSNDGGSANLYDQGGSNKITLPDSSDFAFGTGDFTIEYWVWHNIDSNSGNVLDMHYSQGTYVGRNSSNVLMYNIGGGVAAVTNGTLANSQWHHIAFAREGTNLRIFINGVLKQTVTNSHNFVSDGNAPTIGSYYTANGYSFDGYMSNFRLNKGTAVYTSAFTPSTSALTAVSGTVLLCLQNGSPFVDNSSSSHTITTNGNIRASEFGPFTGTSGEGGLVWLKERTSVGGLGWHSLFDTARGTSKYLSSNNTNAEGSSAGVTAFNSNGFTLGDTGLVNQNTGDFVSWTFRKAPKFFDVVTYSGTGSAQNISHNLGSVPGMIIIKNLDDTDYWAVYHRGADSSAPENYALALNETNARDSSNQYWNNTAPTSSVFTVGTNARTNNNGENYIAYLFAHNNNDGTFGPNQNEDIIKCGSYTGAGSTDVDVDLGFEPQWIMIKKSSASGDNWLILDSMRGTVTGGNDTRLFANLTNAEASNDYLDFTSTGFRITGTSGDVASSGETYIYMAIRRGPLAAPTDATKVFAIDYANGSDVPAFQSGFPIDMGLFKQVTGTGTFRISSRLTEGDYLETSETNAEQANSNYVYDYQNGFFAFAYSSAYLGWMWKRAPGYFDVVAYTGNATTRTINHNLGAVPEMMWVKQRDEARSWYVYHKDTGATKVLVLNETDAADTYNYYWNDTAPTSSVFTVASNFRVNKSGGTYIAYLFATVAGVSKVGSFSHTNETDTNVDCGFSSGARFILIKQTNDTGNWYVFDTVRGIVSGNDAGLFFNNTTAEQSADWIDPLASGFTVTGAAWGSGDYIFYAIA